MACAITAMAATASSQEPAPQPTPKMVVTNYDMAKAAAPPALSSVELTGKKLFVQRCALCHDLLGQPATTTVGPWLDVETVKRGEEAVRQKIVNGSRRMPAWKYTLAPEQIDSVIAYLKTVTPDQRPKPGGPVTGPIE
jgi:mono/diheme cytochrome c family protein